MSKKIIVKNNSELLKYLLVSNTGYNRNKLKSLLKNECISINKRVTTQFNDLVIINDVIEIVEYNAQRGLQFEIIYEDDSIIVINKPSELLSVPYDETDPITTFDLVYDYVKNKNSKAELHIVHRLDQGTSGILMFAKNENVKELYQDNWNNLAQERVYIAYVEGRIKKNEDTIVSNLVTDRGPVVFSNKNGKMAITHYTVIKRLKNNTILRVKIDTGRQNQIRVHLKDLGHPIVGDKKYGATSNPLKRLGLHAYQLKIKNPKTRKINIYTADIPKEFRVDNNDMKKL